MYKLIIGENVYVFEKWEDLQEFIYSREKSLKHKRKYNSESLVYKIETEQSFTITFDESWIYTSKLCLCVFESYYLR